MESSIRWAIFGSLGTSVSGTETSEPIEVILPTADNNKSAARRGHRSRRLELDLRMAGRIELMNLTGEVLRQPGASHPFAAFLAVSPVNGSLSSPETATLPLFAQGNNKSQTIALEILN